MAIRASFFFFFYVLHRYDINTSRALCAVSDGGGGGSGWGAAVLIIFFMCMGFMLFRDGQCRNDFFFAICTYVGQYKDNLLVRVYNYTYVYT